MAWCLTAPSHYLNQCWLTTQDVLLHLTESNFTRITHELNQLYVFRDYIFEITTTSLRGQEVKITATNPRGQWVNTSGTHELNSLAPGRSWHDFKKVIFNLVSLIGIFKSSYDNILRWMPQGLTDDNSTLVQVMAWCQQATSHYLNQCWPRSPAPYGVPRPQWVNL